MNYLITFQSFFIQNHLACNLLIVAVHKEVIRVISKTRVDYTENKRVKRRKNEKQGWSQTETQDAIRKEKYTHLLPFQNFRSKNTKAVKKLIKCSSSRISSTADSDCLKNTLQ